MKKFHRLGGGRMRDLIEVGFEDFEENGDLSFRSLALYRKEVNI